MGHENNSFLLLGFEENPAVGNDNDSIVINASATNWGRGRRGYAEAIGLGDRSSINTGSGDDLINITARAVGRTTNAWAMRDSNINTG